MSSTKRAALPGGANTEEGEGVEILRAGVDPQTNHTTPAGVVSMRSLLKAGEGNAIHGAELADMAGAESARQIRRIIAEEREAGAAILSGHGGYYLPADGEAGQAEIRAYLAALRRKAARILESGVQLELKLMEMERDQGGAICADD